MKTSREAQVTSSPAEVYDELFVPALFQQWGHIVAKGAGIGLGQRVLDVACGTGVLACAAAERVGPEGHVVGLDPNDEMLAVAVCDALDHSPGYAVLAELLHRLFGEHVADAFRAPFLCGDPKQLLSLCADAGMADS